MISAYHQVVKDAILFRFRIVSLVAATLYVVFHLVDIAVYAPYAALFLEIRFVVAALLIAGFFNLLPAFF